MASGSESGEAARRSASCAASLDGGVLLTIHRLSQGGADRVAMLLANGLAAAGIPTGVAVLRDDGEAQDVLLGLLRGDVQVFSAGAPMGSRHLELVRGLRHIRRVVAETRPAVVLASSSNMGLVTGLAARTRRGGSPHYAMKLTNPVLRPQDRGRLRTAYRKRLYRFIFERFRRVLLLSNAEAACVAALYPRLAPRFEVTANPYVTPAMFAVADARAPIHPPTVLTLARMMPQKRLDRLLDAFALTTTRDARLIILGDGPEKAILRGRAEELGITDRVEMPGFVEDVVPWLRRASVFALSSDYEGLPAAVLEALACGVPVVTTDCFEAARALLAGVESCAVVPRRDVRALAEALDAGLIATINSASLSAIARPYAFDVAIAEHVGVMRRLIADAAGIDGASRSPASAPRHDA